MHTFGRQNVSFYSDIRISILENNGRAICFICIMYIYKIVENKLCTYGTWCSQYKTGCFSARYAIEKSLVLKSKTVQKCLEFNGVEYVMCRYNLGVVINVKII